MHKIFIVPNLEVIFTYASYLNKKSDRDLNLFLLKRVRVQLKMSDFPPNCVRFVVYGGVQTINGNIRTFAYDIWR